MNRRINILSEKSVLEEQYPPWIWVFVNGKVSRTRSESSVQTWGDLLMAVGDLAENFPTGTMFKPHLSLLQ